VSQVQPIVDIGQTAVQTQCYDRERQHKHVSVRVAHEQTGFTGQSVQTDPQGSVFGHQCRRSLACVQARVLDGKNQISFK
jgi:hypothetical protein